ncbi:SrfA family protein [Intestinirhabdus alba]|jgi:hypothetical protein|uniref:Virulence effector protein n=1 Tax=Intestinirhabdus alba TaxID=2899544 RepID=A0A6L6IKL9_9ENTR|nr:SrfA family protein [Intestinirhabdus alba]MTH46258.1 hypothetical protein [Intestinirhabdus alba]
MRNSIQGPLLRSGQNSAFRALGETGYPVFRMAFQLREAIYRLDAGRNLARHLAVPQNDQGGDRTDWYSSFPGDVIPWSAASESERASARQQFSEFQIAVQALSEQMRNAEQNNAGGDRQVFARLLTSVVHFPDYDFVYLVDGVLVITFWGFIHPTDEPRNPMHWLNAAPAPQPVSAQASVPPVAPLPATGASAAEAITLTQRRGCCWQWRWRWLLWPLFALLLLALALGLLRGCAPALSPTGLTDRQSEETRSGSRERSGVVEAQSVTKANLRASAGASTAAEAHLAAERAASAAHSAHPPLVDDSAPGAPPLPSDQREAAAPAVEPPPPAVPAVPDGQPREPLSPIAPPAIPAQGEPLSFPPTLPDGPARFLNGQWRVNGGIQDTLTGRPLQLQYTFKEGNGTVNVRQSSGVVCTGSAAGGMQQGTLRITSPEQMKCSDGSNFIVPAIECTSPSSGHADCVGSNDGSSRFPIRMLQPNT